MGSFGFTALSGVALCGVGLLAGCGAGSPDCGGAGYTLYVSPAAAEADHLAAAPLNQTQFTGAAIRTAPPGCPVSALALGEYAAWTNPDPKNIQISSALDPTNGTAVCTGATTGAVTLTGAFAPGTMPPTMTTTAKTVQLTCK